MILNWASGKGTAEYALEQEPITTFIIAAIIITLIAMTGYYGFKTSYKLAKKHLRNVQFDFGLARKNEVYEKVGKELGDIIIAERKIVFYRFGWLWALLGSLITIIIQKILW